MTRDELMKLATGVREVMARCEALEDEADNALAEVRADKERGFLLGQRSTAKSLRRQLGDMIRSHASSLGE